MSEESTGADVRAAVVVKRMPPREIRWGEATTDEMCLAYVGYVLDREDLTKPRGKRR